MFAIISHKIILLIIIKFILVKCVMCDGKRALPPGNLENCDAEFSGYQFSISSPNYPENYPENLDCVYVLRGSPLAKCNQIFNLHFLDFQLRISEDCTDDFLEIGENNLFCGKVVGIKRYSSEKNNSLIVRFHSGRGSEKGFKILVTTLPCPIPSVVPISNETLETVENGDLKKYWDKNGIHDKESLTESSVYPVYRPETAFTIEENIRTNQEQLPQKLEVLNVNNNGNFQLPIYTNRLFKGENDSVKRLSDLSRPAKISAYFFNPPDFDDTKSSGSVSNNNINLDIISAPPSEFLLPTKESSFIRFSDQNESPKISNFRTETQTNQKLIIPASSYGVPSGNPYSHFDTQLKTGEVLENADCEGKANIDTFIPVSTNFREGFPSANNYPSGVFNPQRPSYPATIYGAPSFQIPPLNPVGNPPTPAASYGPPLTHQPGSFPLPDNRRPVGFQPSPNIGNIFPGSGKIAPNINAFGQCCRSQYSSQRFLLVSPGFPSLIHSGNNYQCAYTIAPYSPNVCRLRLHFKFFNHGADDQFCRYGFLEIDGRRYCGCRTGLTVISSTSEWPTKTISVGYVGYPQTKLNGFSIEVFQETCSYNGYPYLSRSKKEVNSTQFLDGIIRTSEDKNSNTSNSLNRNKRQLGYSYPKPSIPFGDVGGQLFHSGGIGNIGFTSAAKCQASSIVDWVLAAKEIYLKSAKCIRAGENGGFIPGSTGNWIPSYPGNGNINPGYPINGNGIPVYPNPGNFPVNTVPGYPGPGNYPGYPGSGNPPGISFPVYPGAGNGPGKPFPGYPGSGTPSGSNFPGQPIPGSTPGGFIPGIGNGVVPAGTCETVSVPEGLVSSPGYPNSYPNGIHTCYRFYRSPDSCQLQLSILDFDVEASPGCVKDYLVIGNQNTRYCGRTLAGSKTLVDFPRNNIIDIRFFADALGSGRGFNIGFFQSPCPLIANR